MLKACHQYAVTNKSTAYTAVEAMVACGMAMCLGCAVKASKGGYLQVCKDGPVFDSKDLLWE
jgi:dihydroorotate dehydrogenase electron transfer subunit